MLEIQLLVGINYFIHDLQPTCPEFADGSFILKIPNFQESDIEISINGGSQEPIDFSFESNDAFIIQPFEFLYAGYYSITIINKETDCELYFGVKVPSVGFTTEFLYYDKDEMRCYYDYYCKGDKVSDETSSTEAFIAWIGADGGANTINLNSDKCEVPIICNGAPQEQGIVYWWGFGTKKVKFAEYQVILIFAQSAGMVAPVNQALINSWITNNNPGPCDKVRYCPASFRLKGALDWGGGQGTIDPTDENGCTFVNCGGIFVSNFTFCNSSLDVPSGIQSIFDTGTASGPGLEQCEYATTPMYQLTLWYAQGLLDDIGGDFFELGKLGSVIQSAYGQGRNCGNVVYCCNNWEVLIDYSDNFPCGEVIPADVGPTTYYCEENFETNEVNKIGIACTYIDEYDPYWGEHIFTYGPEEFSTVGWNYFNTTDPIPESSCLYTEEMSPMESQGGQSGTSSISPLQLTNEREGGVTKILDPDYSNCSLKHLGVKIDEDIVLPVGIIETDNLNLLYLYGESATKETRELTSITEHYIDDWSTNQLISIQRLANSNAVTLSSQNLAERTSWVSKIASNNSFQILHLSKTDKSIFVGGTSQGNIFINKDLIAAEGTNRAFILEFSFAGELISYEFIENVNLNKNILFSNNVNGEISLIGGYSNDFATINNNKHSFDEDNGVFHAEYNSTNGFNLISSFKGGASFQPTGISQSLDGENTVISFLTDEAEISSSIPNLRTESNQLVVLSLKKDGTINWIQQTDKNGIDVDKMDMIHNSSNELILGLTYNRENHFFGKILKNHGGEDITFFKFSSSGKVVWDKQYGYQGNESVTDLLYDSFTERVYFGGEVENGESIKTLGDFEFIHDTRTGVQAYISHIMDNSLSANSEEAGNNVTKNQIETNSNIAYIQPNPFGNSLHVNIDLKEADEVSLKLYNEVGALVKSERNISVEGKNNYILDTSNLNNGIYFIQISSKQNDFYYSSKIIKFE